MLKIRRWLKTAFVIAFALIGAQLPKMSQDYQRQFSVRCSELSTHMQKVCSRAEGLGEIPEEYIRKHFLANGDEEVAFQGRLMLENWDRYALMKAQIEKSKMTREWLQPLYWILHQDVTIARDTWKTYEVGFTYTLTTFVWGCAGALLGLSLFGLARSLIHKALLFLISIPKYVWNKANFKTKNEPLSHRKDDSLDSDTDDSHQR